MNKTTPPDFFNKDMAQAYDERNSKLSPISDNMHFLIRLVLRNLPEQAHILCVGVGTGAEILSLAKNFPSWSFVGVEPSASMLEVCRERLQKADVLNRCTLIHGYVEDAPSGESFDAALSVLVAHFIKREDRLNFFQEMTARLKKQGYLINTELCFDLDSDKFPSMLKQWEKIQELMGATEESLSKLPIQLREVLTILPPEEAEAFIKNSGVGTPTRFFQSFMIHGWFGQKS